MSLSTLNFTVSWAALATIIITTTAARAADSASPAAEDLAFDVLNTHPHDTSAFTQGLLFHEELLYESTGLRGRSTLRAVDIGSGDVLRKLDLEDRYFAEGLARRADRLVQLTWQENTAFVYDLSTFNLIDQYEYTGEGWGLCFDGDQYVMSDGSDTLAFRHADTFELLDTRAVTLEGEPLSRLNELECVGDAVWANVWQTDLIVRIETASGNVTGVLDAAGLLTDQDAAGADVLNGIAHRPETDTFYITGKLWPKLFEIRIHSGGDADSDADSDGDSDSDADGDSDGEDDQTDDACDCSAVGLTPQHASHLSFLARMF